MKIKIKDIPNPAGQRFARVIDRNKDGELSTAELDAAAKRPDAMATRLLEKAYGDAVDTGAARTRGDLEKLLQTTPAAAVGALPGPSPQYDRIFQGPRSEWVVAFGGDSHHAASELAPPDVAQYRGFKAFLERQGFHAQDRVPGQDNTGFATFTRLMKAPPDGHEHTLTVKVFNSSQFADAADEYQKTSAERRGYFSLSHAGEGLGMGIGGTYIRPENVLRTPAPGLIMAPIACRSYEHFAGKIDKYLQQNGIPKDKVSFFGTSQEIEMTQADGAMAVLKQVFAGALAFHNGPTVLRAAQEAYNPIMSSYDPASYERDPGRMVMDQDIRATPVLKALVGGQAVELPKKTSPLGVRTGSPS